MISPQNNNSYPTCRICRSDEPKSFIAPCKCKGTVKYVHRSCLMQWRKRLILNGSPQELDICNLCKFRYIIKQKSKFGNVMARPEIRFIISCIIILIMLFPSGYIMKLIMSLTSKIYLRDGSGINNIPVCSSLTKASVASDVLDDTIISIVSKDYYDSLISIMSENDFWIRVMCNDTMQHLYLGLFFLGSVSNIVTAYFVIDELLDLFHHHQQQQLQDNFENHNKKFILWGSCAMVIGFWFHYTLSSFKVPTNHQEEFPLRVLRWLTISTAVFDFGLRRIFRQLNKIDFGDGEVISIQKLDFND